MNIEIEHRLKACEIAGELCRLENEETALLLRLAAVRIEAGRFRMAYREEDDAADLARLLESVGGVGLGACLESVQGIDTPRPLKRVA